MNKCEIYKKVDQLLSPYYIHWMMSVVCVCGGALSVTSVVLPSCLML